MITAVSNSKDLQRIVDGSNSTEDDRPVGTVYLENGDYDISPAKDGKYRSHRWLAASPTSYGVRVRVHDAPLLLGHFNEFSKFTLSPWGDFAAARLDKSSRAMFSQVILRSRLQEKRGGGSVEKWDSFEREGIGIETTDKNIGDDAWGIKIYDCLFECLTVGIKAGEPGLSPIGQKQRKKGTINWYVQNTDFDGCLTALDLIRAAEWHITGGLIQLAETGIRMDGMCNWIREVGFERGKPDGLDIQFSNHSCHNRTLQVTAPPHRVNKIVRDKERDNKYSWVQKRAIWRPCKDEDANAERSYPTETTLSEEESILALGWHNE